MDDKTKNELKILITETVKETLIDFFTNQFVSKKEAARIIGISESTIHRKIKSGLIKTEEGKITKEEVVKFQNKYNKK